MKIIFKDVESLLDVLSLNEDSDGKIIDEENNTRSKELIEQIGEKVDKLWVK